MPTDRLTFANFDMNGARRADIYELGAVGNRPGFIREISPMVGHQLTREPSAANLGTLIEKVAPAADLRQNIEHIRNVMVSAMGSEAAALNLVSDWVHSTELFAQVRRSFMNPISMVPRHLAMAIVFGGSGPSMKERVATLKRMRENWGHTVGFHILAGGKRPLSLPEVSDDRELHGKAEYEYLDALSRELGSMTMTLAVDLLEGEKVAERVAYSINLEMYTRGAAQQGAVAIVSNAGAWVQQAGQLRRAMGRLFPDRHFDEYGDQLYVAADATRLSVIHGEHPEFGMHPFRALGQMVRNAQELAYTVPA